MYTNWSDILDWAVSKLKGKLFQTILLRFAWTASLYYIWRERNLKKHIGKHRNPEEVFKEVISVLQACFFSYCSQVK